MTPNPAGVAYCHKTQQFQFAFPKQATCVCLWSAWLIAAGLFLVVQVEIATSSMQHLQHKVSVSISKSSSNLSECTSKSHYVLG